VVGRFVLTTVVGKIVFQARLQLTELEMKWTIVVRTSNKFRKLLQLCLFNNFSHIKWDPNKIYVRFRTADEISTTTQSLQ
jgi:hypothetical protein